MNVFKPSPRYLTRLRVVISLWALSLLALGILTAGLLSLDARHGAQATRVLQATIALDLLWYLPALRLVRSSYLARTYQFNEDEIIVQSGWWTETVRRIPMSSVTGFEMRWDRLDRWLEIGTLEVTTASWRSVTGSKVRLSGLADVEMVAGLAARLLQRMRDERLAEWLYPAGSPERQPLSLRHQTRI
jgi:membrane protein YdbS with pleckstrin-like domain